MSPVRASSQRGFTLLELLVVLVILAVLVGLVTPYLAINTDKDTLAKNSQALRFDLQDVLDQSWIEGKNRVLSIDHDNNLVIWQYQDDKWQKRRTIYQVPEKITFTVKSDKEQIEKGFEALDFEQKGLVIFLSNGEYTPFSMQLVLNDSKIIVAGDGVNAIRIQ